MIGRIMISLLGLGWVGKVGIEVGRWRRDFRGKVVWLLMLVCGVEGGVDHYH